MGEFSNVQTENLSVLELENIDKSDLILLILNLESEKRNTEAKVRVANAEIQDLRDGLDLLSGDIRLMQLTSEV